jgi:proteasome accessory factor A
MKDETAFFHPSSLLREGTMANTETKPFLMGSETEYAVAGQGPQGAVDPDVLYNLLANAIRAERRSVPDRGGYRGMYLENGGRFYLDYGSHPEYATPECFTPAQVACHDKAGETLLELARRRAMRMRPGLRVTAVKSNLDPVVPDEVTYGTHESYTCWVAAEVAAPQMLPHLASRVIYAGAGGLSAHEHGDGFELSQRARHIVTAVGHSTTGDRALFGTRIRKESDYGMNGWVRVHLIAKDSQRAPFGIYLTFATTGLLIEMINRGYTVGCGLALADPVEALHFFSRDPWLRAKMRLVNGQEMTALEIQFRYLEECERAVQHGGLPEWAPEALRHWRETLEELSKDPRRLARRLDAYCKLLIYEHELLRAGHDWQDLHEALGKLALLRSGYEDKVVAAIVAGSPAGLSAEEHFAYGEALEATGAGRDSVLERLRFAVRLQALDVHYHELGGLYDRLREARRVEHVVVSGGDVAGATLEPPAGGRAAARGNWIRDHACEGDWSADWQYLWHPPSQRCLDLRDPFRGEQQVLRLEMPEDVEPVEADVLDLLADPAVPA